MVVKAVSFDVWNTLFKFDGFLNIIALEISNLTHEDHARILDSLMDSYSKAKELRRKDLLRGDIVTESQLLACKELDIDIELFRKGVARAVMNADINLLLFEDAKNVLSSVKEKGLKVAILGNVLFWPGSYTRILIEKAGISGFINVQLYADEVGSQKPHRAIFYRLLEELQMKPEEIIHVGDGLYEDFAGAVLAGLHAILLNREINEIVKVSNNAFIAPTLSSVLDVLDRLMREK